MAEAISGGGWVGGFLQSTAGKVVTAVLVLSTFVLGYGYFGMSAEQRSAIVGGVFYGAVWVVVVAMVPGAAIPVVGWVKRLESNAAAGWMIAGLTLLEAGVLAWSTGLWQGGWMGWGLIAAGGMVAGVYNLLVLDWLAERVG
jgi:hypothetical protein